MDVLAQALLEHEPPAVPRQVPRLRARVREDPSLDTHIGMADRMSETLASKAMRLKLAMLALALAVLLTAGGIGVD